MPTAEALDAFDMDAENMPTDPASFLPLMLQAQDLVFKLESRVVELENDLETINEAHEQEREQLLQEIGDKDEYIHNLKTKVSRLEFGAREAIVVLARTVETLKSQGSDDDYGGKDDDDATAVESTDLEGQFLDSIKLCLNYLKTSQNNVRIPTGGNKLKRFRELEHAPPHKIEQQPVHPSQDLDEEDEEEMLHRLEADQKAAAPQVPVRRDSKLGVGSERDEQPDDFTDVDAEDEKRQRRTSFCSSHVTLDDICLEGYELDGSEDIAEFQDSDEEDDANFASQFGREQRPSVGSVERPPTTRQSTLNNESSNVSVHDDLNLPIHQEPQDFDDDVDGAETVQEEEEEEEDDDELVDNNGLRPPEPIPDITTSNGCTNCAALLAQLDSHIEERAYLKRDLAAIASDLTEEQALRAQIQAGKENLEQEIDDWINAMFEKVNQMMYDEASAREDLEILNREFKGRHDGALKASQSREDRLREMKLLLVHLDSTKQRQATSTPVGYGPPRNSVARRSIMSNSPFSSPRASRNFGHMSPSLFSASMFMEDYMSMKAKKIYIDGVVYEEFQDYVKSFSTNPSSKDLNSNSAFLKRCTQEDIQPCLFEGNSSWKSPFYKRRLLDAIMKNQCEIQAINYSTTNSSPSTPNTSQMSHNSNPCTRPPPAEPLPAPKAKCALCGQSRSCEFRMRLSGPDAAVPPTATTLALSARQRLSVTGSPGWMPIDRFCRDRVVAVCDFYAYLSHVRQGLLSNSPVWSMYKQCLKHRRKMSLARTGSMSMFEQDEAQDFENADMEGMVVVVH